MSSRPEARTTGVSRCWKSKHATARVATIPRQDITAGAMAKALLHLMKAEASADLISTISLVTNLNLGKEHAANSIVVQFYCSRIILFQSIIVERSILDKQFCFKLQ